MKKIVNDFERELERALNFVDNNRMLCTIYASGIIVLLLQLRSIL